MITGDTFLCFLNPQQRLLRDKNVQTNQKIQLVLSPNARIGTRETNTGINKQWIAHVKDNPTPILPNLSLNFIATVSYTL